MVQCQDILWITVTISHTVITLHDRQAIQIRPRQQHKRRSRQDRKRRKRLDYDVCHDAAATPRAAQPNEREKKIGARNGTEVNKKYGGEDDRDVQSSTGGRKVK